MKANTKWIALGLLVVVAGCNAVAGIREPILDEGVNGGSGGDGGAGGAGGMGGMGPACNDGAWNGSETDLDCGGGCSPCDTGKACKISGDCLSKICKGGACEPARCDDGVQNGGEGDTDCGGACPEKCADGKACGVSEDCASLVCAGGVCQVPICGDGVIQPAIGEECDDGDMIDDHCGSSCTVQEVTKIAVGFTHTCALLRDGRVKCWGNNASGQLGLGDTNNRGDELEEMGDNLPAVDLGMGRTAVAIACGFYHTCALLDDGSVKCWGENDFGQLGMGDMYDRGDEIGEMGDKLLSVNLGTGKKALAIAGGHFHTCALLNDGGVKCWGQNAYGELGLGDTKNRGDEPGEMGDNLPTIDLGANRTAVAIVGGGAHTCALLSDGNVKCWGYNGYGTLGLGDTIGRGDGPGEMGDSLPLIDLGTGKTAIAVHGKYYHTCALLNDGHVKCWGGNNVGQLGLGDMANRGDGAQEMGDSLSAIDLGTGKTAIAIAVQPGHTCVLLDDASVKCWGNNGEGQLGLGDTYTRGDGLGEMGDSLPAADVGTGKKVLAISGGTSYTCALLNDGSVKCWGWNAGGQLGLGDMNWRGDEPGEMGDALPTVKLFSDVW